MSVTSIVCWVVLAYQRPSVDEVKEVCRELFLSLFYLSTVSLVRNAIALLFAPNETRGASCQFSNCFADASTCNRQAQVWNDSSTSFSSEDDTEASSFESSAERSKPWYAEPAAFIKNAGKDHLFLDEGYIQDWWICNEQIRELRNPFMTKESSASAGIVVLGIFMKWPAVQVYRWAIDLQFNLEKLFRAQESGFQGVSNMRNVLCEIKDGVDKPQGKVKTTFASRLATIDSWVVAIQVYQQEVYEGLPRSLETYRRVSMRVQEMLTEMEAHRLKYRDVTFRKELFRSLEKLYELHETMRASNNSCYTGFQLTCKAFDKEMTLSHRSEVANWQDNAERVLRRRKL